VVPRAGLGSTGKRKFLTLPGRELRPFGRPARGQSLYRLSYRGHGIFVRVKNIYKKRCKGEWNTCFFLFIAHFAHKSYRRRLCGLVVRVLGYRSGGPGSIPGTTRFSDK
jgi:hypothetical protein